MGHRRKWFKKGHESCTFLPPDGGYGWIVLIGAIVNSICAPSIVGCFGIILPSIKQDTNSTIARTAWISSLAQTLNYFSSPLTAMLAFTYSFRKVAFLGGLLISVGMCLTQFVHQVEMIYLTVGVMGGLGFGFTVKSSLFVINQYFNKHRGLVTGAQYSGSALSRLIFPLIIQGLLQEYGYQGTLLIWGALLAHICAASSLFQPPIWHKTHIPGPSCIDVLFHQIPVATGHDVNKNSMDDQGHQSPDAAGTTQGASLKMTEMKLMHVLDSVKSTARNDDLMVAKKSTKYSVSVATSDDEDEHLMPESKRQYTDSRPLSSSAIARIASNLNIHYDMDESEWDKENLHQQPKRTKKWASKLSCFGHCGRRMTKQLDYSLLKDYRFYIVASSGICNSFAILNSVVFIPPLGQDKGLSPSQTAWLLSSVGIGEIFGRLVTPWLQDLGLVKAKYAYMLASFMSSIVAFALTFPETYTVLIALCICLGISIGSIIGLNAVINAETVGVKRLASSLAFAQFSQGIFILPSGLILGAIRDSTQSYDECFYIISLFHLCSCFIWATEIIKSRKDKSRMNSGETLKK